MNSISASILDRCTPTRLKRRYQGRALVHACRIFPSTQKTHVADQGITKSISPKPSKASIRSWCGLAQNRRRSDKPRLRDASALPIAQTCYAPLSALAKENCSDLCLCTHLGLYVPQDDMGVYPVVVRLGFS